MWHLAAGASDIQAAITSWTASGSFTAVTGQSNFLDNTSNEFYLTGVQFEVDHTGSGVATDFEHRSFGQELALCQRYFWNDPEPSSGFGYYATRFGNTAAFANIECPVTMRTAPTATGDRGDGGDWTSISTSPLRIQFYRTNDTTTYVTAATISADAEL